MKTISLWEPWASLMAVGAKTIETRHWVVKHRGLLAIHAAKRWQPDQAEFRMHPDVAKYLQKADIFSVAKTLGHIVCIVNLFDCQATEGLVCDIGPDECTFGNYEAGRWGWLTKDVRRLKRPIPVSAARGSLMCRLWNAILATGPL